MLHVSMSNLGSNMCFFSSLPAYTYFREWSGGLCVGGFEPVSKPIWSEGVPADFEFGLLPDDWDQVMEASLSLAVYLSFFALSSALSLLSFSLSLSLLYLCSPFSLSALSALPSLSFLCRNKKFMPLYEGAVERIPSLETAQVRQMVNVS